MTSLKPTRIPKGFTALWGIITLVYTLWLALPMRSIVLNNYETVPERTVDGLLYNDITGFIGHHWLYPVWVIVSALSLLAYIAYLDRILYAEKLTKGVKVFCQVLAVVCFVYLLGFNFLSAYARDGSAATFSDKLHYVTASMIGLVHPWCFKLWGILTGTALFTNILYSYRRYGFQSKLGVILGSIGVTAIYLSLNCPSLGETKDFSDPRCIAHWGGALLFAVLIAAPLVIFLFRMSQREKGRFRAAFYIFVAILALMVILLIAVGKSATIENLPIFAGFILLYMLNFTDFFVEKKAE